MESKEEAQASNTDLEVVILQEAFKTFYPRQDKITNRMSVVGEEERCSGRGREGGSQQQCPLLMSNQERMRSDR